MRKRTKGFTLTELLITIAVILPIMAALMGLTVYTMRVGETSRGVMTAMQDANTVVERMRNLSKQGLAQVTTNFPDGAIVPGFSNLPNERIVVDYVNPGADPLEVTVTVSWLDRNRPMTRVLTTHITRR